MFHGVPGRRLYLQFTTAKFDLYWFLKIWTVEATKNPLLITYEASLECYIDFMLYIVFNYLPFSFQKINGDDNPSSAIAFQNITLWAIFNAI